MGNRSLDFSKLRIYALVQPSNLLQESLYRFKLHVVGGPFQCICTSLAIQDQVADIDLTDGERDAKKRKCGVKMGRGGMKEKPDDHQKGKAQRESTAAEKPGHLMHQMAGGSKPFIGYDIGIAKRCEVNLAGGTYQALGHLLEHHAA